MVLSIVANMDLEVQQLDVKTSFLHGDLEEEIYMHKLEGFVEKGKERNLYAHMAIPYSNLVGLP